MVVNIELFCTLTRWRTLMLGAAAFDSYPTSFLQNNQQKQQQNGLHHDLQWIFTHFLDIDQK